MIEASGSSKAWYVPPSPLRWLRPCWTAFLNSLRRIQSESVSALVPHSQSVHVVCQKPARIRFMSSPLVLLLDACTDRFLAGGKAAGLARLMAEGFPVPPGLCLTVEAYRQFLRDQQMDAEALWKQAQDANGAARASILKDCRKRIQQSRFSGECLSELERHLEILRRPAEQIWAVRSSATNEDDPRPALRGCTTPCWELPELSWRPVCRRSGRRCGTSKWQPITSGSGGATARRRWQW